MFSLTAEQELLASSVDKIVAAEVQKNVRLLAEQPAPSALVRALAEAGLLGVIAPEEVEGASLSAIELMLVVERLARGDAGLALAVLAHNLAGPALAWSQSDRMALSTGASIATLMFDDALAPAALSPKMMVRTKDGQASRLVDCTATPKERLGLVSARWTNYQGGRVDAAANFPYTDLWSLGLAAVALGVGNASIAAGARYANERKQFGTAIATFQAIQWKLADSATMVAAAEGLVWRAAHVLAMGRKADTEVTMARLAATDAAMLAADHALQIHGGYGYVREFEVERFYRDAKSLQTFSSGHEPLRASLGRSVVA